MEAWEKEYRALVAKHKLSGAKKKKLYDLMKSQADIQKSLKESEGKKVYLVSNLKYISRWDDFEETEKWDIYKAVLFKHADSLDLNQSLLHTKNLPIRLTYTKKVFKAPHSKIFDSLDKAKHEIFNMIFA